MDESLSEEGLIRSDDEVLKETESEAKEIDGKDREYGLGFGVKQFGTFHNSAIISKKPKDKPAIWSDLPNNMWVMVKKESIV